MPYGKGLFEGHSNSINDVAWAPIAGRTFHMIVSADSNQQIIVWKVQTKDVFDLSVKFDNPKVEQMFSITSPPGVLAYQQERFEILRLRWNATATCFAGSCEDGTVRVW